MLNVDENVKAGVLDLICCLDVHSASWLLVAVVLALCSTAVHCNHPAGFWSAVAFIATGIYAMIMMEQLKVKLSCYAPAIHSFPPWGLPCLMSGMIGIDKASLI